ncbi:hypothetical protein GGH12_002087 [Coemansia sp. RSA 1822]|nr:hypothetical protein GGF49_001089 [Coemansia sp. RSA 1853]KAJ2564330.1 hypothetical protein GGH12_002087 [Coemansia sp. RSA 1822]
MYYYSLYIGLLHTLPTERTRQHKTGKSHDKHSSFDVFCSHNQARDSSSIKPFIERTLKHAGQHRAKRTQPHSDELHKVDYRVGRVQIEWWDTSNMDGRDKDSMRMGQGAHAGLVCSAVYEAGILRLYRSHGEHADPECLHGQSSERQNSNERQSSTESDDERPHTLAVLAVPGYMTPTDFLSFTAAFSTSIKHIRVVRDNSPSHYMILLQFRSLQSADEFYAYYNGKTFSPLEPETCHVVYIRHIECELREMHDNVDGQMSPGALFLAPVESMGVELPTCPVCLERLDSAVSGLLTTLCEHVFHCRCLAQWGDGNCPVCRYSQSAALVDHKKFEQTVANAAPVDYASRATEHQVDRDLPLVASTSSANIRASDETSQSSCHVCSQTHDLWICLICGTIGCGRYANAHAKDHFEHTQHPYSMELDSQNVWDYVGDGYVHRLLQNAADRKVIALDAGRRDASNVFGSANASSAVPVTETGTKRAPQENMQRGSLFDAREKLDAVTQEYELLLVTQLESQREHFEVELARMRYNNVAQSQTLADVERRLSAMTEKCHTLETEHVEHLDAQQREIKQLTTDADAERKAWALERKRLENNAAKWVRKSADDARLLLDERALSRQLAENQDVLKNQITELNASVADLQEQVRDLSFFITTQKTMADNSTELHGASIVGVAEPPPPSRGRGKRRIPRK